MNLWAVALYLMLKMKLLSETQFLPGAYDSFLMRRDTRQNYS